MSSSRIASIRFQSVRDGIFVFFPLFMICLSKRNNANVAGRQLNEGHHRDTPPDHSKSNPALFSVFFTYIWADKKRAMEHLLRPLEVETVLPDVGTVLSFVPFEF